MLGYAPRREADEVRVRNCPFDKLRGDHHSQVCAVNLALAEGCVQGLGLDGQVQARLRPCSDTCCVVFDTVAD